MYGSETPLVDRSILLVCNDHVHGKSDSKQLFLYELTRIYAHTWGTRKMYIPGGRRDDTCDHGLPRRSLKVKPPTS